MSWLTRQFGIGVQKKTVATDDIMSVVFANEGKTLITSARSAMEKSVWVYRAVNTVCTRIGSLPWDLYQGDKVVAGKSAVLKRPNPYQTSTEFIEQLVVWQLLKGYGIGYAEPLNLRALDADMVKTVQGRVLQWDGKQWNQLDEKRIVVFPNFSLSGWLGLSELSPVIDAANMDENAKQVWNNQMSSGGMLSGLLSTDQKPTEQELTAIKDKWIERYGGIAKAGTMAFLGAGFKFTQMAINAADMRMLEVSNVTKNEIGTAFGVPGIFLGDMDSVDYSNAQIQERILYSNTVCPKADRLADRITTFLLPLLGLKGLEFRFDYSGIEALQADKLERAQIDEIQIRTGKMTINEARLRDGEKPVKWGDAWWTSAMNTPVTTAEIIEPEPGPPPAPVPIEEPKALGKGLHTPEARLFIAKAFLAKTGIQEKKFAQATMRGFNKQEKRVVEWIEGKGFSLAFEIVEDANKDPRNHWKAIMPAELLKTEDLIDNWHALYIAFGMQSAEEIAARYNWTAPDGSAILAWIKKQERAHSKYVNDTTAQEIDKILSDLRAEGASIPDMVKATKEYFGGIAYRAERVARTEVISVNNMAAQETYVENGVKEHEWLATDDDRTRDDHLAADGQVRGVNEPFDVGGEQLMYPGDPNGSPGNTINCRCAILPVI